MIDTSSEKQWLINTQSNPEKIKNLQEELNGVHPVLCEVLLQRGIDSKEKAELFFRPKLDHLYDPWSMLDMDRAVERVLEARNSCQKIMVLGDYDVDGTTSAAMMYLFLKSIDVSCDYYIPDRYNEGYGISIDSIDHAVSEEFSLMICLDCGIKAIEKVDYAGEKGLDIIICDHHTPGPEVPKAIAVLDPKRTGCTYPFKDLSGCGVGFKLIQAILDRLDLPAENAHVYLDLLATSIAADMVPIVDENRVLTMYGLHRINSNPSIGIQAMKDSTSFNKEYKTSDLVFKIAPRINAAGRMSSGRKAVEILVSENLDQAVELANRVNLYNLERRETDSKMTEEALSALELDDDFRSKKSTVLFDPSWHKGVIGIVASRMIENYYRPTIIFSGDGDVLSGSARSVRNFSVYDAIEECKDLLIQYGGHKYAAGMNQQIL
ncbi:MAG TPA: single-stranded-DNA-specific exonuclease RecJ, partial [Flavobacteriales bacterium]|nr:single-stranded-DNA-specific exonuclease RecJ [Flavobacteriales bacterium]